MKLKMEICVRSHDFLKSVRHPHSFCSLISWSFSYEMWKSELGVRICERVREGDQKLLIRDRVTERRRGQTNYFSPLLRIYDMKWETITSKLLCIQ